MGFQRRMAETTRLMVPGERIEKVNQSTAAQPLWRARATSPWPNCSWLRGFGRRQVRVHHAAESLTRGGQVSSFLGTKDSTESQRARTLPRRRSSARLLSSCIILLWLPCADHVLAPPSRPVAPSFSQSQFVLPLTLSLAAHHGGAQSLDPLPGLAAPSPSSRATDPAVSPPGRLERTPSCPANGLAL